MAAISLSNLVLHIIPPGPAICKGKTPRASAFPKKTFAIYSKYAGDIVILMQNTQNSPWVRKTGAGGRADPVTLVFKKDRLILCTRTPRRCTWAAHGDLQIGIILSAGVDDVFAWPGSPLSVTYFALASMLPRLSMNSGEICTLRVSPLCQMRTVGQDFDIDGIDLARLHGLVLPVGQNRRKIGAELFVQLPAGAAGWPQAPGKFSRMQWMGR
jgi:hypothetical protein